VRFGAVILDGEILGGTGLGGDLPSSCKTRTGAAKPFLKKWTRTYRGLYGLMYLPWRRSLTKSMHERREKNNLREVLTAVTARGFTTEYSMAWEIRKGRLVFEQ